MTEKELFEILAQKDVSEYTEEREGLTYLSWAWAWQEFLKVVPDATYKVKMFNAPDGTLAIPIVPSKRTTVASTVGIPLESRISRAKHFSILNFIISVIPFQK
jgi:hypothetical protein